MARGYRGRRRKRRRSETRLSRILIVSNAAVWIRPMPTTIRKRDQKE
jgi:hypothetical protein